MQEFWVLWLTERLREFPSMTLQGSFRPTHSWTSFTSSRGACLERNQKQEKSQAVSVPRINDWAVVSDYVDDFQAPDVRKALDNVIGYGQHRPYLFVRRS